MIGASGGDGGARDWMAALDAATGKLLWRKYTIPAPGEPGSGLLKDKNNAWQTGGGAVVTGTYDPDTNQTLWGVGNRVPMIDARARAGRQPVHQQRGVLGHSTRSAPTSGGRAWRRACRVTRPPVPRTHLPHRGLPPSFDKARLPFPASRRCRRHQACRTPKARR